MRRKQVNLAPHKRNGERQMYVASHQFRQAIRAAKGRDGTRYAQWDQTAGTVRPATITEDPILNLAVARQNRFNRFPESMQRYGEIRQRVVSPVLLP